MRHDMNERISFVLFWPPPETATSFFALYDNDDDPYIEKGQGDEVVVPRKGKEVSTTKGKTRFKTHECADASPAVVGGADRTVRRGAAAGGGGGGERRAKTDRKGRSLMGGREEGERDENMNGTTITIMLMTMAMMMMASVSTQSVCASMYRAKIATLIDFE